MNINRDLADPNGITREELEEYRQSLVEERNMVLKSLDIREKNLRLCARLKMIVPKYSHETIFAIETHKSLLHHFLQNPCFHAASLQDAISKLTEDKILVYIAEIFLYGVFTLAEYVNFIGNIQLEDDEGNKIPYTPKQITLSGFPQRIVFMCTGDDKVVAKIKKYCEIHFKSKVQINNDGDKTDVIIQSPIVKNLAESQKMFEEFCKYVSEREDIKPLGLCQDISRVDNMQYIMNVIADHRNITKIEELLEKLSGFPLAVNINITNNINNGGNFIIGDKGVIFGNNDPSTVALAWIKSNPPNDKEITTEYYNRYVKNAGGEKIVVNLFGKLVRSAGYETGHGSKNRYWKNTNVK